MGDPRDDVALASAVLGDAGLGDMVWGHLSVRDPSGRGAWIKASGWGLEEITPDRVMLVDWQGRRLEGSGNVHIEVPIHTEVLSARPDVGSVVHCHPGHAIAFAATGEPLRALSHEGCLFTPPDIARFTLTGDLIRTPELGRDLAGCLGLRNAVFLPHHGIVTVGDSPATAVMASVLLERACQLQLLAMAAGGVGSWSSDEEALAKRERCWSPAQLEAGWEYLVRRVQSRSVPSNALTSGRDR
jgi:ribulose-5-phosphate 4-epimerase/fuculose-1-phosphate aldolase